MTEILERQISRGDLYYADLRPVVGCEQGGVRPVLVIQNDVGNQHSPTVIAAAITGRKGKHRIPPMLRYGGSAVDCRLIHSYCWSRSGHWIGNGFGNT